MMEPSITLTLPQSFSFLNDPTQDAYQHTLNDTEIMKVCLHHFLFTRLRENIALQHKSFFQSLTESEEKSQEKDMIDIFLIRCLICELVMREEYTLDGLAYYTQAPLDLIVDVAAGRCTSPPLQFAMKIIELYVGSKRNPLLNQLIRLIHVL